LVRQDDEAARKYIVERLGLYITQPFIGLMVEKDGKNIGAVILNDYRPKRNIELTAHTCGNWSVRDVRDITRYCFIRVKRITARTAVNNTRAIRMLETLGFKREGMMREWFDDSDAIVFGLLKSEQRIYREG
jgi:hypothetical protein